MAILLVHQTKALKQVHEGSTDPGLMQEQRTATDLALRATKVTAQSLGKSMSTIVVPSSLSQESGPPRIPARPQVVQEVDESAMTWATRRCWTLLFLRRRREQRRSFPRRRAGRRILCFFVSVLSKGQRFPLSQRKSNFLRVLRSMGRQCATPCFLTLIHDPSCKQPRECGSSTCSRRALTTAYVPRRMVTPSRDDRLIWSWFGEAQVNLFASHESSHRQLYFSLTEGGRGAGPASCATLAHPDLVSRTHFPRESASLVHSSEKGPPLSGARHHMAPASISVEPTCVAPGRDVADLSGLSPAVVEVETITQARAPSTRQTYALKWSLFTNWCSSRREDPRRCIIGVVLSFLQERLERRLSPSTLKVYVAAIAAHHNAVDGRPLGKHDLIVRFLKGARRMNPSRPPLVPSWDLSVVLAGLQRGPFDPFWFMWVKEQRLGYHQQRCTQWSLRAPMLANLR